MEADGASIIDIGGESTRPGSEFVELEEELNRTIPVIREIRKHSSVLISIDTTKHEVARQALLAGADMVNDISAGEFDPKMISVVRQAGCPFIAMHIKGTPKTMQREPDYGNAVDEIYAYFADRTAEIAKQGVTNVIIDPGIGFGKQLRHNLQILRDLKEFQYLGYPVCVGASRKSMIGEITGNEVNERLSGTLGAHLVAWINGADLLRVHDVRETAEALKVARAILHS
jgi:dihydropteroate synthase